MKYTLLLTTLLLCSPTVLAAETPLRQLFNEYCVSCHGEEKQEADVRLNRVGEEFFSNEELLATLVGVLEENEMPPRKQTQPPSEMRAAVVKHLKGKLQDDAVPSLLKRLTREEYTNTINDLFGTQFNLSELLPEDSNEQGFNKLGESHLMSPHQVESYLKTARFIADRLVLDEKPEEREWVFGPKHFHGSGRGDYQTAEAHVLSTNYPWRSNLHFSTSDESYDLFVIPQFGRYRFEAEVTIANSNQDQTVGFTLGDPRYPTNFKKITRLLLPNDATSFSIDLTLKKGSQVSFTFDSASTWNVGQKPENYKGVKLFFTKVRVIGPIYEEWPTAAEKRIFATTEDDASALTEHLLRLFTHRSLPAADVAEFTQLAQQRLQSTSSKKAAARTLITAILSSPYFLYKHETPTLDDLSLALRLSYFLWNSAPDTELIELAKSGHLRSREALRQQVTRMLSSPKVDRFCDDFTRQWLQTDKIDDVGPDERVNKDVTTLQIDAIAKEAKAFFQEILANDLSMLNFIDSDFVMVNDLSARFYGFKGVTGRAYRPYELSDQSERGGLIGQAGFLKLTSSTFETSPIQRGAWILKNIYGENIDPPADLKFEEPDIRGTTTVKEVIAKHQSTETCFRCHAKIDPLGFALEHYDPLGRWRDEYRHIEVTSISNDTNTVQTTSMPIESESTMLDGRTLNSMSSLKEVLMDDREAVLQGILSKLVSYSMGRETGIADEPMIDQLYDDIAEENYSLRAAILAITTHQAFRRK